MKKRNAFALGSRVRDEYGFVGTVDAVFVNLAAAEDCGLIDNAKTWLSEQERRPRTPATGVWYSVVGRKGAVLVGEKDLRSAK